MKYYLANPVLDEQVADACRRIRLAQNGVVAEHMAARGATYRQNYGVAIPTLRELARRYPKNRDLAQRLWSLGIRETMILATLVAPADTFTPDDARQWIADFNQVELVEQACMNLFVHMPQARELCVQLLAAPDDWSRVTAFTLAARMASRLDDADVCLLLARGTEWAGTDNFFLYKAIALAWAAVARQGRAAAVQVQAAVDSLAHTAATSGVRYIVHEVTEELSFLDFL